MSLLIEGMTKEDFFRILLGANCGMFQEEKLKSNLCEGECASYYGYKVKELPPHGRLIDADALMRDIQEHDYLVTDCFNTSDRGMFTLGIRYAIMEAAPTILDSDNNVPCKEEVKE